MSGSPAARERALLLAPAALLLGATVALPMLRVLQLSLSRVELREGIRASWAGVDAFARLWSDSRWWTALGNTVTFTAVSVTIEVLLGTAVALLLHRGFRGRGLARTLVVLPWALPTAVMALAWGWIFNDSFGVANDLLLRLGVLGAPVAWLGRPDTAMAALIVADVWKTTPFVALIALAGLQSIPQGVLEAARVDGLGGWARLRRIVLPLLAPALLVAAAFRAVQAYATFDLVYVLTGGGPGGATETVSLYAFQNYFRYLDFSYGSAIAVQGVVLLLGAGAAFVLLARSVSGSARR
jgi:multiple sugar transport system permease protein